MYSPDNTLKDNKTFVIGLSVEELTLITSALGLPSFLGFLPPEPLSSTAAMTGERSLRARELMTRDADDKYTIDTSLARLLSVCAVPTHVLGLFPFMGSTGVFRKTYDDRLIPQIHLVCMRDGDAVYHNRSQPGMHTFMSLTSPKVIKMIAKTAFQIEDAEAMPDGPVEWFSIDRERLRKYRRQPDKNAAVAAMTETDGLPESLAMALLIPQVHVAGMLARSDWQGESYAYTDDTLIDSQFYYLHPALEGGFWVRYPADDAHTDTLHYYPHSGQQIIDRLIEDLHTIMNLTEGEADV